MNQVGQKIVDLFKRVNEKTSPEIVSCHEKFQRMKFSLKKKINMDFFEISTHKKVLKQCLTHVTFPGT